MLRAGALVVVGGAAVPLTGCDLFDRDDDKPPPPDPLEPLAAESAALAARHRAAAATDPALADRLTPIADAHQAHADELRRVIGRPAPSAAPTGTPEASGAAEPADPLAGLREAERMGRDNAAKACAAAPAERAALLGSIAAARATHVEALK
ncbi:hypothetical protein EV384_2473 [Micromonospora kangleipakensis]|uniref:DUF305 domain-containing protein n=1 Tax=Micromonospora kangleipakensis TaxID=1077942 RepID=A0A4Q8B8J4_9ACTN|nr:hypothetical protein [Micromonospora kangleipakensis]RZU74034.1 hypothetical protein EV384_2473 [Micromonospora kangleipakensis]